MKYLSLCSGIEAATVAWHPLGWEAVAYSEIEKFPSQVLAHHYPQTPNLGDMTKFKEWSIESNVDLLVGGTPCQSFSVAGLRKGLDDPRGNLMLTYLAIAKQYRPNWLVWENVPGVLSSNGGRDFGSFLGGLAECGYGFAYRVLDAQYFGVAQRRRRVFVVGYLGDWRLAAAVLFERHSLSGHPAPSREKREDPAKCLTRGAGQRYDFETEDLIPQPVYEMHGQDSRVRDLGDVCTTVSATYGTGGGNVPVTLQPIAYNITFCDANGTRADRPDGGLYVNETDVTSTLTKAGIGTNVAQPIAFSGQMSNPQTDVDMTQTLQAKNPMSVAWSMNLMSPGRKVREDHGVGALTQQCHCPTQGNEAVVIQQAMAVRRLTPKECERLQGFPDSYTDIKPKGKPTPDGPRYKALGNSMAVPVMAWIGQRIQEVEAICKQNK